MSASRRGKVGIAKNEIVGVGFKWKPSSLENRRKICELLQMDEADAVTAFPLDDEVMSGVFYAYGCKGIPPTAQKRQEDLRAWYDRHQNPPYKAVVTKVHHHRATDTVALELKVGYDTFLSFVNHKAKDTLSQGTSVLKQQIKGGDDGWAEVPVSESVVIMVESYLFKP